MTRSPNGASPEGGQLGLKTPQKPLPETSLRETWKPDREQIARIIDGWAFKTLREVAAEDGLDASNPPAGVILPHDIDIPIANRAQHRASALAKADAILSLAPPVEAGWKLVPVEPTEAMIEAGLSTISWEDAAPDDDAEEGPILYPARIYRAMIEAAPPVVGGGDQEDSSSVARVDMTPPSGASAETEGH